VDAVARRCQTLGSDRRARSEEAGDTEQDRDEQACSDGRAEHARDPRPLRLVALLPVLEAHREHRTCALRSTRIPAFPGMSSIAPTPAPSASVLITNVFNHVQPLIRHRLDDRFVVEPGDGGVRAVPEGRKADVPWFGDVEIHPLTIISELTTSRPSSITASSEPTAASTSASSRLPPSIRTRSHRSSGTPSPPPASTHPSRWTSRRTTPVNPATGKIARFVPRRPSVQASAENAVNRVTASSPPATTPSPRRTARRSSMIQSRLNADAANHISAVTS
jgi:hypothetical protein